MAWDDRHAHDWLALSMLSDDAGAGVQSFLERRKEPVVERYDVFDGDWRYVRTKRGER